MQRTNVLAALDDNLIITKGGLAWPAFLNGSRSEQLVPLGGAVLQFEPNH